MLIQTSLEKNEGYVSQYLILKRSEVKPNYNLGGLIRAADLKKTFSKGDSTLWSYELYKFTQIIYDTTPSNWTGEIIVTQQSHKIDQPSERFNEGLLKKTKLTRKEKNARGSLCSKLNLDAFVHHYSY